ncbi:hypothetical protein N7450_010524 [Penicillium hetheringtonii]|uniref:Uncharacterized protein n=1 Tax=Penicillium hetheringtonii TaxID=911720 RepID=A0AAD6GKX9_9EURO|nr:hypothetical protein N7450_010524 [Penicillium hetheringtonii]
MFNNYRDLADRDQKKTDHLVAFELYRARREGNGAIQRSKKQICFLRDSPEKTSGSWMAKETFSVEVRAVKGRFDLRYNNILGMLATSMKAGDGPHGGTPALIQGLDRGPCTPG